MYRVAWLTCALLALVHARIYDRCELAHELQALGVNPDHLSTWMCIAFHESRFNTAANNLYSGDHGIFQISELYWCGPGKACGLPCSALRDDDISNDFQCALQIHEEHTRLQGNGFLAWVVYPQHCKHNTKKYLVDCDGIRSAVPITKSRTFAYDERYSPNVNYTQHTVENLLPPYLAIRNIFRGGYGKVLDQDNERKDWYNYKIDNIDDLKLPSVMSTPSTTTTSTTSTTVDYIPPVVPWRRIETNQFRKKHKPAIRNEYTSTTLNYMRSTESSTYRTPSTQSTTQRPLTTTTVTTTQTPITTSTKAATAVARTSTTLATWPPRQTITTARPTTVTESSTKVETTIKRRPTTTSFPFTFFTTPKPLSFSTDKTTTATTSTNRPIISTATTKSWIKFSTRTTATSTPKWRWTTPRPTPTLTSTSRLPPTTTRRSYNATSTFTTRKPYNDFSWYTFTSRTASTPASTKSLPTYSTTTLRPSYSTITSRQPTTTNKPKTTQSLFDFYLNPTKPPKYIPFNFDSLPINKFRIKIFAGGTTTPVPTKQTTQDDKDSESAAKNQIKRQN